MMVMVCTAYAQDKVTGKVTDADTGEELPYVTVVLKGTKVAVNTNDKGVFSITAPSNGVLQFSFIGYETKDVAIDGKKEVNVRLATSTTVLDAAVVTGMMTVDRRLFTGASDHISAEDAKISGLADVSRALEGRSAGVSVQNVSGTFGTAPKIRVRGATSIYGSSKPLWVVDGVIMDNVVEVDSDALSSGDAETLISSAIAGLNADDIESFEILKDGSATSIYGAKAMAGVIVVTTKRGKPGTASISYSGEYTMRMVPRYADFNIMDSQEQMSIYQEMEQKGWLNFSSTFRDRESGVYGKMYQLMSTYDPNTGTFLLANTTEAKNAYLREAEMRNTHWFKELFDMNIVQNHSVSIQGGNDKATYFVSFSAMLDPGWSIASSVNRYTTRANVTYNISKKLALNIITDGSYRKQMAPGTLSQNIDAVSGEAKRDFDINPYSFALNASRTMSPNESYTRNYSEFNIFHELNNNYMDIDVANLKFQGELTWKPIKGLEIKALGAIKYTATATEHHIRDKSNQASAYRAMPDEVVRNANPFLYTDPDIPYALPITVLPEGGIYQRTDNKMLGYDIRTTATYRKTFNDDHLINIFAGMELNSVDRQRSWFRGWGRQYEMGDVSYYAYQVFKQGFENNSNYFTNSSTRGRNVAYFTNLVYSYKSKYQFNGTLRYEGSNRLGKARSARWLPTWNVSGSWNIHQEKFFEKVSNVLSHATLKASYSLTGESGPSSVTNSLPIIKSSVNWRYHADYKELGLYLADLENRELTYEKKHELNIGINLGFLNNRINFASDIFWRNNYDLIGVVETEGAGGEIDKFANAASMKSNGMEFSITTKNIVKKDFDWSTNITFGYVKTEITELNSRKRVIDLTRGNGFGMVGYPHRALFSIPFVGLSEDGFPIVINENGVETSVKDDITVYFQEAIKLGFLKYEGPSEPTITGGFGNTFRYKNFKFNVFLTYSFGNKVRLDRAFRSSYSDFLSMPKEFANRWTVPGDEAYTNVPTLASRREYNMYSHLSYHYNAYNLSTDRVADGGFVRLKEISLTYDLPKKWVKPMGFTNMSAKIQATNLFLLHADSKLNGQDPEFIGAGGVSIPVPKQFTFTLRFGL